MDLNHSYSVKPFPEDLQVALHADILRAKDEAPNRLIAAFDADGTLWNTDIGEVVLQYQIDNLDLDLPENPYEFYKKLRYEKSSTDALDWIVKVNSHQKISDVRALASECFASIRERVPTFESMKGLIDFLHKEEIEVYIVTASCKWSVEPFGALFDIPPEKVIGSEAKIIDGIVSEEVILRTIKEGKVTGLLNATGGTHPILCAGNTDSDLALLKSSTHVRLAVQSDNTGLITEAESILKHEALKEGWFHHQYY